MVKGGDRQNNRVSSPVRTAFAPQIAIRRIKCE
jgi:hypothetical protein